MALPLIASAALGPAARPPRWRQLRLPVQSLSHKHGPLPAVRAPTRRAVVARVKDDERPDWLRSLEENAFEDDEVAGMLEEARRDPKAFEKKIRAQGRLSDEQMLRERAVARTTMKVTFRKVDPFDLWLWIEMEEEPDEDARLYLEEVMKAWFIIGRLGGFNAMNLQVQRHTNERDVSASSIDYQEPEGTETALFHAMTDPEYKGCWMRCWFDLGTSDDIALDVLLNSLFNLSEEHVPIKQVVLGGINPDWADGTMGMAERVGSFAPG